MSVKSIEYVLEFANFRYEYRDVSSKSVRCPTSNRGKCAWRRGRFSKYAFNMVRAQVAFSVTYSAIYSEGQKHI